jgi:hypothetical protein
MDPVLDWGCFPCPARGEHVERLGGLEKNRGVACCGLVSAYDHIDIERVQLDAATEAAGVVGGNESRPRAEFLRDDW